MTASFRKSGRSAVWESFGIWFASFLAILVATLLFRRHAKLVATISFLYLPLLAMSARGEDYRDYGVTGRKWRDDAKLAALLFALVVPLYFGAFVLFGRILAHLPPSLASHLWPYAGSLHFKPKMPTKMELWAIDQLLVVALPEEFFYRGFLQTRLRDAWPQGRVFLGSRLGPAFFVTAALFAIGHLAIFEVARLAVFFPALLFGWLRERTGTVVGACLLHAACNLYDLILRASFFTPG